MFNLIIFFLSCFFSNDNILIVSNGIDLYNYNDPKYILNNFRFSIIYDKKDKPKLEYKEYD